MTTRNKFHAISNIAISLDSSQTDPLLFLHSYSGCGTTSSINGFGKETILKKAAKVNEEGHLYSIILTYLNPRNSWNHYRISDNLICTQVLQLKTMVDLVASPLSLEPSPCLPI